MSDLAPVDQHPHRLRRLALALAAVVVSVNIWTGAPLLALWVGSQTAGSTRLNMGSVVVVLIALATFAGLLVWLLARINAAYERAAGHADGPRTSAPWLRSLRGERPGDAAFLVVEQISVYSAALCALLFNIWFFFFAGSPLAG
ncbi:MAG TPA: hypothetical protein VLK58_06320 [Conexibacter sp.]|nr:hypothetical protein [Conexibacter sp.]